MPMLSQYKKSGCNTLVFLALAAIIISDSTFRNHPHVLLILKLLSIPSIIIAFSCIKDSTFTNSYKVILKSIVGSTLFSLLYCGDDTDFISATLVFSGVFACFFIAQLTARPKELTDENHK